MSIRSDVVSHPFTADLIRRKAESLSRSAGFSRSDEEDLRQEMTLYLWTKARLFDPDRGSIESFVSSVLTSWVGMEVRRRKCDKRRKWLRVASLEGTIIVCDGEPDTLGSVLSDSDGARRTGGRHLSVLAHAETMEAFRAIDAMLTPRERALLRDVIDHGLAGAARLRRVSRHHVARAVQKVRVRLTEARAGGAPTA
jgi:DNA-directed RNA polymerase specialized sigma24 family protein